MCYTGKDSAIAYVINLIACIFLIYTSKSTEITIVALFLLFVGQMQMFDYIFWNNRKCNVVNRVTTKTAIIFNHLQPIILFSLLYYYNIKQNNLTNIVFILYLASIAMYTMNLWNDIDCTLPNGENNLLDWKWNKSYGSIVVYALFLAYLTLASFSLPSKTMKFLFAFINIISFYVSTKTPIFNFSIGRIWCYYASLLPVVFIFINQFMK